MAEVRMIERLSHLDEAAFNACYGDEVENYLYVRAVEEAGIEGFDFAYLSAWEGELLIAVMPAFYTDYALDTTLQGLGKRLTTALRALFPNLLTLKLACLGSPCTETGVIGFHPSVSDKAALLGTMIETFERDAIARGCSLVATKDIGQLHDAIWQPVMRKRHYAPISGMASAFLAIDFNTIEEYFARLSSATRKNMRRKLKHAQAYVEIRHTTQLNDVMDEVMALYHETRSRSDWQFEELTAAYFTGVLSHMQGTSFATLYYAEGRLLAINLLLHNETILLDKFFCMNAESGRAYHLYFLSWFTNIRYCLEHGLKRYEAGQAAYDIKLRLRCTLTPNQMYFKHRNRIAQRILNVISPLLAIQTPDAIKEAA